MGRATRGGDPASNKREAVLAAAVRCFAERGLNGAGMREIARGAGLTEGTLYHYFPSKEALIAEAFRWSAFQPSEVRRTMRRLERPLHERLAEVGEEFLAALRRDPAWTRVVIREALRGGADGDNPVREALVGLATERTRELTAALRDDAAAGRIRPCEPRRVAEHMFRALIGHFVAEAIGGSAAAPRSGEDPFLAHLTDTLARDLARGVPRAKQRRTRRSR